MEVAELALVEQARGYTPMRNVNSNMTHILAQVRDNARVAGFDFSAAFVPPPNSPQLAELMKPFVEVRDKAVISAGAPPRWVVQDARAVLDVSI